MPFAFKNRITHILLQVVSVSILLDIINTFNKAYSVHSCLQMALLPCQLSNKFTVHAQQRAGINTMAIFINGTYFLDILIAVEILI